MFAIIALLGALTQAPADSGRVAPGLSDPRDVAAGVTAAPGDTVPPRRRKAIEISNAYATRLKIHYLASYATIPVFAAEGIVGQQLYASETNGRRPSDALRTTHDGIALALGGLFLVNTVTGSINWWESRGNPQGRTWRTIHAALMLAADAGFTATAALGSNARGAQADRNLHKNFAIGSASVALASYVMMWKPFRRD